MLFGLTIVFQTKSSFHEATVAVSTGELRKHFKNTAKENELYIYITQKTLMTLSSIDDFILSKTTRGQRAKQNMTRWLKFEIFTNKKSKRWTLCVC